MPIERGRYRFAVNETPRGTLCITAYLVGDTIPSLDGMLGFDLAEDTTQQEAMRIADVMNKHIKAVTLTSVMIRFSAGQARPKASRAIVR